MIEPDVIVTKGTAWCPALDKAGTKHMLEVYSRTHHGFCVPERQVYDALMAAATGEKIFAFWYRHLH